MEVSSDFDGRSTTLNGGHGAVPWGMAIAAAAVGMLIAFGYTALTNNSRPGSQLCSSTLGTYYDQIDGVCKALPFQAGGNQPAVTQPSGAGIDSSGSTAPIKTLAFKVPERYSGSYAAADYNLKFYEQGVIVTDPTVNPIANVSIVNGDSVGAVSTGLKLDHKYQFVADGANTYYDVYDPGYVFPGSEYQKYTDTFTKVFGLADYPTLGTKVGTISVSLTNTSVEDVGVTLSSTTITYNKTQADGAFCVNVVLSNTASNTGLNKLVIAPQNDQTTAMEGDEIQSLTWNYIQGKDFLGSSGVANDITAYNTAYQPIPLGNMKGNENGQFQLCWTIVEANLADGETMHYYIDDNGGYLSGDVLPANKKATVVDLKLVAANA
jgi:hypothetical protein